MKTLSQACTPILTTAEKTNSSPARSPSSLTNKGGQMITIPQRLSQKTPKENDKSLSQYLKHTLKLPLNTQKRTIFTKYGTEFIDKVSFGEMTPEQISKAKSVIEKCKTPLPEQEIIKLIARLQIICPEKEKTEYDKKARIAVWVEELSKYPADVVTYALKMRYKWFPALSEVLDNCDNEVAYRNLLERGIKMAGWR